MRGKVSVCSTSAAQEALQSGPPPDERTAIPHGSASYILPSSKSTQIRWLRWIHRLLHDSKSVTLCTISNQNHAGHLKVKSLAWPACTLDDRLLEAFAIQTIQKKRIRKLPLKERTAGQLIGIPYRTVAVGEASDQRDGNLSFDRFVLLVHCSLHDVKLLEQLLEIGPWIMRSLDWIHLPTISNRQNSFAAKADARVKSGSLVSFIAQHSASHSQHLFYELVRELTRCTASKNGYIVKLKKNRSDRIVSHLIATSNQSHIDNRLAASRELCLAVEQDFLDDSLKRTAVKEKTDNVQGAIASKTVEPQMARLALSIEYDGARFVFVLEREDSLPFSAIEREHIAQELNAATPICIIGDLSRLGVKSSVLRYVNDQLRLVRESVLRRIVAAVGVLGIAALTFFPVENRISAPFTVEAADRNVIVSPGKTYLKAVYVNAGDVVQQGDLLAQLDDRELQLQSTVWKSELQRTELDLSQALSARDRVQISRLKEERDAIDAEIAHLALQIDRYQLRAPIDGVVLSGQWLDALGAAIDVSDVIFEIGTQKQHRLVLSVAENRIGDIREGQSIRFRLAANPGSKIVGVVSSIMPLAIFKSGENYIDVHASIAETDEPLRPGMSGIAKIVAGRDSLALQWLRWAGEKASWVAWRLGIVR